MESKRILDAGAARILGATLCTYSRTLREYAPHTYFPGWEATSFEAITQRVALATWYAVRNRAFEVPKGTRLAQPLLQLFVVLSGPVHRDFGEMEETVFEELFSADLHPETAMLRNLADLSNDELRAHAARLLDDLDPDVREFVSGSADAYVRDLYGAMNGVQVYMDAWQAWHAASKAQLAAAS